MCGTASSFNVNECSGSSVRRWNRSRPVRQTRVPIIEEACSFYYRMYLYTTHHLMLHTHKVHTLVNAANTIGYPPAYAVESCGLMSGAALSHFFSRPLADIPAPSRRTARAA